MENLKIIENELVPVYETSTGEKVVYGTELHVVLEVKSNYREWINRRFSDIDAISNEDFEAVEISTPSGQRKKDHIIKLDTAKEMAMLERNEKGKQVRRYFIEVEKRYKEAKHTAGSIDGLSPQLRFMINMELKQKEQDAKLSALDDKVSRQNEAIQTVKEAMTDRPDKDFSQWITETIRAIANSPSFENNPLRFQSVWSESYKRLTDKAGCRLDTLLKNAKQRAAESGASKSKIKAISKLSVIADNKRLKELYITCIREMMIAYCIEE